MLVVRVKNVPRTLSKRANGSSNHYTRWPRPLDQSLCNEYTRVMSIFISDQHLKGKKSINKNWNFSIIVPCIYNFFQRL